MAEVIDFGSRREQQSAEERAEERAKATAAETSRRLHSAGEIAAELRQSHRIASGDRPVLAANLGRMWCEAFPKDAATPLSKLFETAFGRQGPVQYKKRARFILFDGEDPGNTLNAHGANFADLAEAITALAHAGQPDDAVRQARQRAILQLVEGSSFDRRRPPAARLRDEAVAALIDCCDRMVRRVEEAVDLTEMRATLQNDAVVAVIDGDGAVESLHGAERLGEQWKLRQSDPHRRLKEALDACSESERMTKKFRDDLEALGHLRLQFRNYPLRLWPGDLDLSNPDIDVSERWSRMAPRVVLGEVLTPVEQKAHVVLIDIDEGEINQMVQDSKASYGRAIARHGLTDAPAFDYDLARRDLIESAAARALARRYGYPDEEIDDKRHALVALAERIEEDGFAPPRDPWEDKAPLTIWARRRIELQLAFDATTERWRLCLALVPGVGGGVGGPDGVFGSGWDDVYGLYDGGSFEPSLNFGMFTESIKPSSMEWGSLFLQKVGDDRFMVFVVENEGGPEEFVLGIRSGCLAFPSESCLRALFTAIEDGRIGDHRIEASLDAHSNRPAPAPAGTLAGMILRNLAYAPEDERYDLRLLADATAKATLVADFARARREAFLAAIRRTER